MRETAGMITSSGYPNLPSGDLFERVAVLNGPKRSRYQLNFKDIDLDITYCGRFLHEIYLFDGLPNSSSIYAAEFISYISGGNILTNKDNLNHTSNSNVVSVWFYQHDFGAGNGFCDVNKESFRGFRLDWKIIS